MLKINTSKELKNLNEAIKDVFFETAADEIYITEETSVHFVADDKDNEKSAQRFVQHLKRKGISAEHHPGPDHHAVVKVTSKDPAHHEHVRKIAKRRYDTDIYGS